jgi:hypothetical protein
VFHGNQEDMLIIEVMHYLSSSTALFFGVFLLGTGFTPAWIGTTVFWKTKSLFTTRARSVYSMHDLTGAGRENYEASRKMVRVR